MPLHKPQTVNLTKARLLTLALELQPADIEYAENVASWRRRANFSTRCGADGQGGDRAGRARSEQNRPGAYDPPGQSDQISPGGQLLTRGSLHAMTIPGFEHNDMHVTLIAQCWECSFVQIP